VQQLFVLLLELGNIPPALCVELLRIVVMDLMQSQQAVGVLLYLNVVQLVVGDGGYGTSHHASLKTKAPTASIAASQPLINSPAATAAPSIPPVNIIRPAMTASPSRIGLHAPSGAP